MSHQKNMIMIDSCCLIFNLFFSGFFRVLKNKEYGIEKNHKEDKNGKEKNSSQPSYINRIGFLIEIQVRKKERKEKKSIIFTRKKD